MNIFLLSKLGCETFGSQLLYLWEITVNEVQLTVPTSSSHPDPGASLRAHGSDIFYLWYPQSGWIPPPPWPTGLLPALGLPALGSLPEGPLLAGLLIASAFRGSCRKVRVEENCFPWLLPRFVSAEVALPWLSFQLLLYCKLSCTVLF